MIRQGMGRHCARWSWFGLIAAVLALGAGAVASGDEPNRAARWAAGDAALYLEVMHPSALVDRLVDPRIQSALSAVPHYKKALEGDSYRQFRSVVDMLANRLGTTWRDGLRDLTAGGLALAVEGAPGQKPRVFVVVTPMDKAHLSKLLDALLDLARKDAEAKGEPDPIKSKEYRGVTGYGTGPDGALAIVEGSLVIADKDETLKTVIDRALDGPKPGTSLAESADWKARHEQVGVDALAWGLVRLDRLRALDPKKFTLPEKLPPPPTFLFGSWIEALRTAPWISATLTWTESRLGAELSLPGPSGGFPEALKGFIPPKGAGAPSLPNPPGTILSASLWRDIATIWEARADLFPPETVQNLAKLDGVAGQFFGGRDFGTGILGAIEPNWRFVIAQQDHAAMKPSPDVKLPAFALVVDLKPDDEDFHQRLRVAFQSFIGLANLGAAQQKAPPLELGSETFDGVTISTAKFMPPKTDPSEKEPVHGRHNFSPSAVQVGNHFILSSSLGLARDLIRALKAPAPAVSETLVAEADGTELGRLIDKNRNRLVMQNMLEKGHDKEQAEAEVGLLADLVRYLGHGRLAVRDNTETVKVGLEFALGK
jgi:hypothetical protein